MKVILQQEVKNLGKKGDIVEVSEGYGRNYLFPRKLAIPATDSNVNTAKQQRAAQDQRVKRQVDEAKVMAAQMSKLSVSIGVKTGDGGRLFGSVTGKDIADALQAQHGVELDRRKIELKEPLKTLGRHPVPVRVHPEIMATIEVHVQAE